MNTSRHTREATLLVNIFLLSAIEFLQSGMITFAAGPISGEIGASPEEFTLSTAVYAVIAIAAISKQRWLIERIGWRRFLQAAVAVFVLGAAICASSASFPQYLLGRMVMALGGGPFLTSARVMVTLIPPSPRRFRGILAYAGALTVGVGSSPWLASIAVSQDRWPLIFALVAGLAILAGLLGSVVLPTEVAAADKRSQAHPWQTLVMTAGAFLSLYALLRASYDFYADALPLLLAIVTGTGALLYFGHHQYHHAQPLLVMKRLRNPRYVAGMATFTLGYMLLGANNYMLPVLMQGGLGFPWQVVGMVQSAGLIVALPTFSIMATVLKKNQSAKKFYVTGFVLLMLSGLLLSRLNGEAALWADVWPGIALFGAFITPVMVTTALHSFMDLQGDEVAFFNGQQLKNMLSQFGVALGVALAALGLQWRGSTYLSVLVERFHTDDPVFNGLAAQLSGQLAASHGQQATMAAIATLAQQLNQQAILLSSFDYFGFLVVVGLAGVLLMLAQRVLK
ncbi:MFS transporter [Duganella callida]|uniref:MFS transporter n=1 Tax=Duganella callida TaxID=2561932 RepID=A0A4Y9SJZ1_9BURK|nr:MFS transporter [Duganella callida]TFW21449.1 MFS transporter [Duganella callida]